jgi:lipopolysaccharide export LptBFGC system permease protein LptF
MLKNKIYNYIFIDIIKNFLTILITFTLIAWTVRAVNFLDLMIEDGFSLNIYTKYSLLNITTIASRFVSLSFLLALIISIIKFEKQQELLILWINGLNKIKIANVFLFIGFIICIFQLTLTTIINPTLLNKSRALLRETESKQINSILKSNDFSDAFKSVTFYIEEKNKNNELINIFIQDNNGSLQTMLNEIGDSTNTTIVAKKGIIRDQKLILNDGLIQTLNKKKEVKNINFERTELSIENFNSRTIIEPKIQETSTLALISCFVKDKRNYLSTCPYEQNFEIALETISRRIASPLYIPLISIIISFLLIYKKEKKFIFLKKYFLFTVVFLILVFTEILGRFSGISPNYALVYFLIPLFMSLVIYLLLIKNLFLEKIIK